MKIDKQTKSGMKLLKKFGQRASCSNCQHLRTIPGHPSHCPIENDSMFESSYYICSKWEFHGDPEFAPKTLEKGVSQ